MYNKTLVILLSGKMGSGKSFFADKLLTEFKAKKKISVIGSLAIGIKEIARKYMGWDGKKDERGRKLLQMLGTEVGREYNKDCWVEYMINTLENKPDYPYDVIIIDDWRFPSEYEYFLDKGMYTPIKVKIYTSRSLLPRVAQNNHPSENSLPEEEDYYDYIVYNDFDESNFVGKANSLCNTLDSLQSKYKGEK